MIHEYALDPEAVADWSSLRFFIDQFGIPNGRLISKFPKKWKKLVYQAVASKQPSPINRARIEEKLKSIDRLLLEQSREYDGEKHWITNAIEQNRAVPFHAIISADETVVGPNILKADRVDVSAPLWAVGNQRAVERTAEALGGAVRPLLESSTVIKFVDPHFDPTAYRFRESLAVFVQIVASRSLSVQMEYHFLDNGQRPLFNDAFEQTCRECLTPILPSGIELRLVRWKERGGGEDFHARCILTNRGGILIERGLDTGYEGQTTPVILFTDDLHAKHWDDFQKHDDLSLCTYDFDNEMVIIGEKE